MYIFKINIGLAFALSAWLVTGCVLSSRKIDVSYQYFPQRPLYVQSLAESQIIIVDAQRFQVIGTLNHPLLRAASAIEVDSQGHLFIAIDADATHDYREIWKVDPETGEFLNRIMLPGWAPTLLAMASNDLLLVGHSLEKRNGSSDLDVIYAPDARYLQTLEIPGLAMDIAFDTEQVYVAISSSQKPSDNGVLAYNLHSKQGLTKSIHYRLLQPVNQPSLSPVSLASAQDNLLYLILFQYDANKPCEQHGQLMLLNITTRTWTPLMMLDDIGPIAVLSDGTLIVGEACPWGKGRLLHIDPNQRRIIHQMTLKPGVWTLCPLGFDIYAVGINPILSAEDDSAPLLFVVDARAWHTVAEIAIPLGSARDIACSRKE